MHLQIIDRIIDKAWLEVGGLAHEAAGGGYLIDDEVGADRRPDPALSLL